MIECKQLSTNHTHISCLLNTTSVFVGTGKVSTDCTLQRCWYIFKSFPFFCLLVNCNVLVVNTVCLQVAPRAMVWAIFVNREQCFISLLLMNLSLSSHLPLLLAQSCRTYLYSAATDECFLYLLRNGCLQSSPYLPRLFNSFQFISDCILLTSSYFLWRLTTVNMY